MLPTMEGTLLTRSSIESATWGAAASVDAVAATASGVRRHTGSILEKGAAPVARVASRAVFETPTTASHVSFETAAAKVARMPEVTNTALGMQRAGSSGAAPGTKTAGVLRAAFNQV